MINSKDYKWHESITIGIMFFMVSLMFFFNGFSYLANSFIKNGEVKGEPTKAKGVIAFVSLLENSWWKYIFIVLTLYLAYGFIKHGIKKHKKDKFGKEKLIREDLN